MSMYKKVVVYEVPECNLEFWQNRTQTDNVAAWLDEKVIYEPGGLPGRQ